MPSLTSSTGSILGGFQEIISGLIQSVLAIFTHAWHAIEGVVNTAFSLIMTIVNTALGLVSTVVGIITGACVKYRHMHGAHIEYRLPLPTHTSASSLPPFLPPSHPLTTGNIFSLLLIGIGVVAALVFMSSGGNSAKGSVKSASGRGKKRA